MESRMDKYSGTSKISRRTSKNQELYQDLKDYTNLKEEVMIEPVIQIDLDNAKKEKREIKYQDLDSGIRNLSPIYQMNENKEYDISKVLTSAKENRMNKDELEEKRSLKKDEYNITKNIDLNHLEEYKTKKEVLDPEEKEELEGLIHTIYNKDLKSEIEKKDTGADLMSDLMPKNNDETIIDEEMAGKIIKYEKESLTGELSNLDQSFFTKSLELSKKDLDMDTSFVEEEKDKKWVKVLAIVVAVILVLGLCYYMYSKI